VALDPETCGICGRNILRGERTQEYVNPDGHRAAVCDLCRARVQRAGWLRAGSEAARFAGPQRQSSRVRAARQLLRTVRQRARAGRGEDQEPEEPTRRRPPQRRRAEVGPPRTASRPRTVRETPERRLRRALERFNESEYRRTVAGLTRSLGSPRVAAVMPPGSPDEVRLTVAWDLSWYQWEVRLADQRATVHSVAKGNEIEELPDADRSWNATVGHDGRLRLGLAANGGSA
jgi:hypothetical protein